jgi:CHASE1-domain containing sensor protein
MHKFSWRTLLIFAIALLLGVMLIGLGTAYVAKLKQQRRQLSDNSVLARSRFNCQTAKDQTAKHQTAGIKQPAKGATSRSRDALRPS